MLIAILNESRDPPLLTLCALLLCRPHPLYIVLHIALHYTDSTHCARRATILAAMNNNKVEKVPRDASGNGQQLPMQLSGTYYTMSAMSCVEGPKLFILDKRRCMI